MNIRTLCITAAMVLLAPLALAQEPFKEYEGHRIFYSAFNSSFITPEVAQLHSLSRGSDQGLVNIAVVRSTPEGDSLGLPAGISGQVTNLIQQTETLEFAEIRDGEAVYYLAPFKFENEDALHFDITVSVDDTKAPYTFRFTRTLYED